MDIGTPVSATDPDASETLTYSLAETDTASFGIIPRSGQLQTKAALDFEIKSTYTVTVTATDREDLSDDTRVTITVKDVGTPAPITSPPGRSYRETRKRWRSHGTSQPGSWKTARLHRSRTTASSPPPTTIATERREVPGWTVVPGLTSTAATITGLTGDSYYLQVRAVNTEGKSPWPEGSVTVTLNLERPEVPGTPTLTSRATDSLSVSWTEPEDNGFTSRGTACSTGRSQKQAGRTTPTRTQKRASS